ncbi:DUF4412 domain-containing protein [Verrucomicrobium spinosum]|uniref:DUF4412 domain-containing protein n=1 Tax=Verrucomicrobium spinosum TaxID=2736 RepID=UPI0012F6FE6C|nr:DUF4412 domain-containing protein [Verrucomicrobium spinosum]
MKPLSFLAALLLTLVPATGRADLTLVQKSNAPGAKNPLVMKVKGGKIRIDFGSDQTNMVDTATGEMIVLNHLTKKMTKSNYKTGPMAVEIARNLASAKLHRPLSTGKTEKVGAYDCDIHEWDFGGGIKSKLWVAKNYPNYEAIKADLATMSALGGANVLTDINGMVVKNHIDLGGATATTTLEEAKIDPLPDTDFVVPAGYVLEEGKK